MDEPSLLERYTHRRDTKVDGEGDGEDVVDDLGCFGWLRGHRDRALMLELRKKTGAIQAIGYSWLQKIEFEPSSGITLWCPGQKVRIVGRNLNTDSGSKIRLFEGLTRHKVLWIREATEIGQFELPESATSIERIDW
jgi:hypothetical protein